MKFILICASGRSGSTTLQRIIDTIPDSNITGEKCGAIMNLLQSYLSIKKTNGNTPHKGAKFYTTTELTVKNIKQAWYNTYNLENVKNNIKNTIITILTNNNTQNELKILGYKEVRWNDKTYLLNAFLELFPNTKIICHIRENTLEQINYRKNSWVKYSKKDIPFLKKYNNELKNYAIKNKKKAYFFSFEKMFNENEMKKLFKFLNENLDLEKYKFIINYYK